MFDLVDELGGREARLKAVADVVLVAKHRGLFVPLLVGNSLFLAVAASNVVQESGQALDAMVGDSMGGNGTKPRALGVGRGPPRRRKMEMKLAVKCMSTSRVSR